MAIPFYDMRLANEMTAWLLLVLLWVPRRVGSSTAVAQLDCTANKLPIQVMTAGDGTGFKVPRA